LSSLAFPGVKRGMFYVTLTAFDSAFAQRERRYEPRHNRPEHQAGAAIRIAFFLSQ
jgi:hypothetical protein